MQIKLHEISIRDVVKDYKDKGEEWVSWYDGKLNIRPPYQREFVYSGKQRDAVIETVKKDFPLNVLYWCKNEDDTYEVLDGQQRIISISQYVNWDYSIDHIYFHNLTNTEQDKILDYKLMIYFCEWNDREKLDRFKTINIAWEKLTDQELRNAVYTWPWLSDAKRHFSKTNCPAYLLAQDYVTWSPIRQEYLQTAISWINDCEIEDYMSVHQHDQNANELWLYFQSVISRAKLTFVNYRKEMKGVNWWYLYNTYKDNKFDTDQIEEQIKKLMQDEDVTKKSGIYPYILTKDERYLNIRAFTDNQKRETYERQQGICPVCGEHFDIREMEADHITPRSQGGKTTVENCQMLCRDCNRRKSDR